MNGIPEVTNAWLSLAHDEFGADAGPVARRRHPDFLRTVQFVLPGVAQVRRAQTIAAIANLASTASARPYRRPPGRTLLVRLRRLRYERAKSGRGTSVQTTPRISVTKTRVSPPRIPACGTPRSP